MAKDDDVPQVRVDNDQAMVAHVMWWIRENETAVERLAAETGKRQKKTIGMHLDNVDKELLRVKITCEPREFAKLEMTCVFAALLKKRL
jgi:hypothetical protein